MAQELTRRGFLRLLGLAAPVAVAAPKYFFAPIGGWKSDVIFNPENVLNRPSLSAVTAIQMEQVMPELEDLYISSSVLWEELKGFDPKLRRTPRMAAKLIKSETPGCSNVASAMAIQFDAVRMDIKDTFKAASAPWGKVTTTKRSEV